MRKLRKKLSILASSHPILEQKALRFFHSIEEIKQILEKNEKTVKKI